MTSEKHYLFLANRESAEPDEEIERAKSSHRELAIIERKLWALIDAHPFASGIRTDSLRSLLIDPERFDA
jgi:hypothetical protein